MYEIKLVYPRLRNYKPSITYTETLTYAATIDLFLRGIYTVQTSATRIGFESERDRTLGLLLLSDRTEYTPVIVEKDSSFE